MYKFSYILTVFVIFYSTTFLLWDNPYYIIKEGYLDTANFSHYRVYDKNSGNEYNNQTSETENKKAYKIRSSRSSSGRSSKISNTVYFCTSNNKTVSGLIRFGGFTSPPAYNSGSKYPVFYYGDNCLIFIIFNCMLWLF